MKPSEFKKLNTGDAIRPVQNDIGKAYIVLSNYGRHIVVAQFVQVTNPSEWRLNRKLLTQIKDLQKGFKIYSKVFPGECYIVTEVREKDAFAVRTMTIQYHSANEWWQSGKAELSFIQKTE